MKKQPLILLTLIGLGLITSCSAGDSSGGSDSDSGSGSDSDTGSTGSLALGDTYPEGLAVSALSEDTTEGSTTGALTISTATLRLDGPEFSLAEPSQCSNTPSNTIDSTKRAEISPKDEKPAITKISEEKERLTNANIESCFTEETQKAVKDAFFISASDNADGTGCYRPDWGIIGKSQQGESEPCMVSHARNEFFEGSKYIDVARSIAASLICAANATKNEGNTTIPDTGSIDLTTPMQKATEKFSKVTVSKARLTKLPNDGDYSVYRSDIRIKFTITAPDNTEFSLPLGLHVVHSPRNSDNTEYQGTIWMNHPLKSRPGDVEKRRVLSVNYKRDLDEANGNIEKLNFEIRMAKIKLGENPFKAAGSLDFNHTADASSGLYSGYTAEQQNDFMDTIKLITYEGYPSEHVQNLSYWVNFGGRYEEQARGYTFNIKRNEAGEILGCALAGATKPGLSIRKSLRTGDSVIAEGFWRPFCQSGDQNGTYAWKQCFKRGSDGKYVLDNVTNTTRGFDFIVASDSDIRPPKRDGFQSPDPGDAPEVSSE